MARSTPPFNRPVSRRRVSRSDSARARHRDRLDFEARDIINDDGETIAVFLPHRR